LPHLGAGDAVAERARDLLRDRRRPHAPRALLVTPPCAGRAGVVPSGNSIATRGFRMPEHTIPESLIDQIRSGRAVLVVGAGIGVPSWKQLLERMNEALRKRGRDGDDAAAKDLDKLLHKGSLARAVGFLARALGEEACDEIVKELWTPAEGAELPGAALAI